MTTPTNNATFYADFKSLAALKHEAKTDSQKALRGAAQQFESLFINMMLKSARSATSSVGDSLGGGSEMDLYQGMFDQQIATQMAKGKGLGLADMLVQQLNRSGLVKGSASPTAPTNVNSTDKGSGIKISPPQRTLTTSSDSNVGRASARQAPDVGLKPNLQPSTLHTSLKVSTDSGVGRASARLNEDVGLKPNLQNISPLHATSPADFVQKLWPQAQAAAQQLGVDPTILIAHAALETGWGKHVPCNADGSSSFNLFGIKAGSSWNGQSIGTPTMEFSQGVAVKRVERFKAYDSPAQCFADYASMLAGHARYGAALNSGTNTAQFAHALKQGGYATDPDYVAKLKAVARSVMSIVNAVTTTSLAGNVTQVHSAQVDT